MHKRTSAASLTLSWQFPSLPRSSEADLISACTALPSSPNIQLKCRKEVISLLSIWKVPSPLCSYWKAERERKRNTVVCLSPRYCLPLVAKFLRQTHAWLETCLCQRKEKKKKEIRQRGEMSGFSNAHPIVSKINVKMLASSYIIFTGQSLGHGVISSKFLLIFFNLC